MAVFVLINDPKNVYSVNANHLEKALSHMDAAEYARYKYSKTITEFNDKAIKKINEYAS